MTLKPILTYIIGLAGVKLGVNDSHSVFPSMFAKSFLERFTFPPGLAIVVAIVYSYSKSAVNDVIADGELIVKRRPISKIK